MTCDRRLLSAYRDGDLTPTQRREVDGHVQTCAECAAILRGYVRLAQTIRSTPAQPVPSTLRVGLRQRIAEREAAGRRVGLLGGLVRAAAPTFAAAAVALTALVVLRPGAAGPPAPAPVAVAPTSVPTAQTAVAQPVGAQSSAAIRPATQVVGRGGSSSAISLQLQGVPASIARLYEGNATLREQLGAPADGSKTVTLMEQSFQGGLAIRRGDSHQIYVLKRGSGGTWSVYTDSWRPGDSVTIDAVPPPGAMLPAGGFGNLWRTHPEIKARLGWAVYEPRGSGGAIQTFERGTIIWSPHGLLYVLSNDGTWKTYPDATPL